MKKLDLTGQRFGRLTVLGLDHKTTKTYWKCKCDCGNIVVIRSTCLLSGNTRSCKCFAKEQAALKHTIHGFAKTKLYNTWRCILKRTGCKKGTKKCDEINYIDRGIGICKEWENFTEFKKWSLTNGYKEGLEIDRVVNSCSLTTRSSVGWQNTNSFYLLFKNTNNGCYRGKLGTLCLWRMLRNKGFQHYSEHHDEAEINLI